MNKINKITEDSNPKTKNIDKKNINEILNIINNEDKMVADAVGNATSDISRFIDKGFAAFTAQTPEAGLTH